VAREVELKNIMMSDKEADGQAFGRSLFGRSGEAVAADRKHISC
jgi:hypothetical protein